MNRTKISLGLIAAVVAVGVGFAVVHRPAPPKTAPLEAAAPVVAGTVTQRDMPILINALGTVRSIQTVNVQSRVNGQIMQAFFKQGELVKAGDPLFLIDPRPYQAALDQAGAARARPGSGRRGPDRSRPLPEVGDRKLDRQAAGR